MRGRDRRRSSPFRTSRKQWTKTSDVHRGTECIWIGEDHERIDLERESARQPAARSILPNVKDEPRRERARLVLGDELLSVASFRDSFDSTSRDRSRRWL